MFLEGIGDFYALEMSLLYSMAIGADATYEQTRYLNFFIAL